MPTWAHLASIFRPRIHPKTNKNSAVEGILFGIDFGIDFGVILGPKLGPKIHPKWVQGGPKRAPEPLQRALHVDSPVWDPPGADFEPLGPLLGPLGGRLESFGPLGLVFGAPGALLGVYLRYASPLGHLKLHSKKKMPETVNI